MSLVLNDIRVTIIYPRISLVGALDARAGSLWHKIDGVTAPRKSLRHKGGQLCLQQNVCTEEISVLFMHREHAAS